jgi:DNA end-binding protein Ku
VRSIWKGSISFGLVTIPVKLFSATEERDVQFNQVHAEDGGRIRYKRICEIDGKEVEYSDIAKGYQLSNGEVVVLTDEDFKDLPLATSRAIDVLEFVPLEQVDPIYFAKSYYLEPERTGTKPYVLLRDALEQSDKVAVVKVALRQREQLATLRVRDGVFVLETMLWPDEIRVPEFGFLEEDVEVRPQELTMAGSLIDSLTADFDPSQFADEYREALEAVISAKIEGHEVVQPAGEKPQGGAVLDLMAALRASVEAAKGNSGSSGQGAGNASPDDSAGDEAEQKSAPMKASAGRKKADDGGGSGAGSGAKAPRKKAPAKSTAKSTSKSAAKTAAKSEDKAAPRKRKTA